ncbi:MAG: hypothetical protein ACREMB_23105, partial [Candidatus Rokuibacteriota bacterium]
DRDPASRQRGAMELEGLWRGGSEKDRVVAGVAALLGREGRSLPPESVAALYDRARDHFTIPGWEALPREFVEELRRRLAPPELQQFDALADRYRLFHQRFFRAPSALAADPAASAVDLARLLHSLGNRMGKDQTGDAEQAYRLSLRLRPEENLAHAGLALLLDRTGRVREAATEARHGLEALDALAARAASREPSREDIGPFRSPTSLREALERVARGG